MSCRRCCIPGCPTHSGKKIKLCTVPAKKFCHGKKLDWAENLEKIILALRKDEKIFELYKKDAVKICELHFEKDAWLKGRLQWGSLPKLNMPKEFDKIKLPRPPPKERPFEKTVYHKTFANLKSSKHVPKSWIINDTRNENKVTYSKIDNNNQTSITVHINENFNISASYYGWVASNSDVLKEIDLKTNTVCQILNLVQNLKLCPGLDSHLNPEHIKPDKVQLHVKVVPSVPFSDNGECYPNTVKLANRAKKCSIFIKNEDHICKQCLQTRRYIERCLARKEKYRLLNQHLPLKKVTDQNLPSRLKITCDKQRGKIYQLERILRELTRSLEIQNKTVEKLLSEKQQLLSTEAKLGTINPLIHSLRNLCVEFYCIKSAENLLDSEMDSIYQSLMLQVDDFFAPFDGKNIQDGYTNQPNEDLNYFKSLDQIRDTIMRAEDLIKPQKKRKPTPLSEDQKPKLYRRPLADQMTGQSGTFNSTYRHLNLPHEKDGLNTLQNSKFPPQESNLTVPSKLHPKDLNKLLQPKVSESGEIYSVIYEPEESLNENNSKSKLALPNLKIERKIILPVVDDSLKENIEVNSTGTVKNSSCTPKSGNCSIPVMDISELNTKNKCSNTEWEFNNCFNETIHKLSQGNKIPNTNVEHNPTKLSNMVNCNSQNITKQEGIVDNLILKNPNIKSQDGQIENDPIISNSSMSQLKDIKNIGIRNSINHHPTSCTDSTNYGLNSDVLETNSRLEYESKLKLKLQTNLKRKKFEKMRVPGDTSNEPYRCDICFNRYVTWYSLRRHYEKAKHVFTLKCKKCSRQCKDEKSLIEHLQMHEFDEPIKCDLCDKNFKTNRSLSFHKFKTHNLAPRYHKSPRYTCKLCNMNFGSTKKILRNHMLKSHFEIKDKPFCDVCDDIYQMKCVIEDHQVIFKKPYKCTICGKAVTSTTALNIHLRIHARSNEGSSAIIKEATKNPYKCNKCPKIFYVLRDLERHKTLHTGEKQFQCEFCGKLFSDKGSLNVHTMTHTGMPFHCELCKTGFQSSTQLSLHILTVHKGLKPFKCLECKGSYTSKAQLKHHTLVVHKGVKPFKCKTCPESFKTRIQLKNHLVAAHKEERAFKCNICPKAFNTRPAMKKHTMIYHFGQKPYKCSSCTKSYADKTSFNYHKKKIHGDSSTIVEISLEGRK